MSLFLDYLWIWIVLTFAVGFGGGTWYLHDQRGRNFIIAIAAPILTLALGLSLYYGIDTDRKSIRRSLNALITAVECNDLEEVYQHISPKAVDVRILAERGMKFVTISRAKYLNLEIEVNDATSPPVADVRFNAMFYWKNKEPVGGFFVDQPVPENIRFEIELVKTKSQSWLVSKCPPPRGNYDSFLP